MRLRVTTSPKGAFRADKWHVGLWHVGMLLCCSVTTPSPHSYAVAFPP